MAVPGKKRLQRRLLGHPRAYRLLQRAYTIQRFLRRTPHEQDFACFAHYRDRAGLFLDVGANTGVSALSFRIFNRRSPILSIEPNRFHEADLKLVKLLVRRFDYLLCGAGEVNETRVLRVPTYRGIPLSGEATVSDAEPLDDNWSLSQLGERPRPGDFEIVESSVQIRRLDDLALAPSFVKVDVEGFELEVLRGLEQTLRAHDPILLVEAAANIDDIARFLATLGFASYAYDPGSDRLDPHVDQVTRNRFFLKAAPAARRSS